MLFYVILALSISCLPVSIWIRQDRRMSKMYPNFFYYSDFLPPLDAEEFIWLTGENPYHIIPA